MTESYREIPLTRGQVALVDAADYDTVSRFSWWAMHSRTNNRFYAARKDGGKRVYMHRSIIAIPDGMVCDHINHDTLDNRRANLRAATEAENRKNRRRYSNNSSGFKGVSWSKRHQKWVANIFIEGKYRHLGYFIDKADAARAYDAMAKESYGEFACLNFPH